LAGTIRLRRAFAQQMRRSAFTARRSASSLARRRACESSPQANTRRHDLGTSIDLSTQQEKHPRGAFFVGLWVHGGRLQFSYVTQAQMMRFAK